MPEDEQRKIGLRERKKRKTRTTIQQNALRLFREQGYQATTVEQIAEASEISPSTFFRYFPSKEAVVLEDDYDPFLIEIYRKQPLELSPIRALRKAIAEGFALMPEEEHKALNERIVLSMAHPELRAAAIQQVISAVAMIGEIIAQRHGLEATDLRVSAFASAIVGVVISAQMELIRHPEREFVDIADEALALMERGFPL